MFAGLAGQHDELPGSCRWLTRSLRFFRVFTSILRISAFFRTASARALPAYISQGEGAYPLVALLESQIIESPSENPDMVDQVSNEIRMLYPEPTVWLTHPMIVLTDEGGQLAEAMLDPDIQALAWPIKDFRPSVPGVQIDLSASANSGQSKRIDSVVDMPVPTRSWTRFSKPRKTKYVVGSKRATSPDCTAESAATSASPVAVRPRRVADGRLIPRHPDRSGAEWRDLTSVRMAMSELRVTSRTRFLISSK